MHANLIYRHSCLSSNVYFTNFTLIHYKNISDQVIFQITLSQILHYGSCVVCMCMFSFLFWLIKFLFVATSKLLELKVEQCLMDQSLIVRSMHVLPLLCMHCCMSPHKLNFYIQYHLTEVSLVLQMFAKKRTPNHTNPNRV